MRTSQWLTLKQMINSKQILFSFLQLNLPEVGDEVGPENGDESPVENGSGDTGEPEHDTNGRQSDLSLMVGLEHRGLRVEV